MNLNAKISTSVAVLSSYNLFHIWKGNEVLFSNAVSVINDRFLEFGRQFAASVYTHFPIVKVETVTPNHIVYTCDNGNTYRVVGFDRQVNANGSLYKPETLVDKMRSYSDDDSIMIVLDFNKAGDMSKKEYYKIKHFMNRQLGGLSNKMQIQRTVYYKYNYSNQTITIGLYDLQNERIMTAKPYDFHDKIYLTRREELEHLKIWKMFAAVSPKLLRIA